MLRLKTAAAVPAISRAVAKAFCRVVGTDDDALFDLFVASATEAAEGETQRALINQTWEYAFACWPETGQIRLPKAPLQEVLSIHYYDADNELQLLPDDDYFVIADKDSATVLPGLHADWPESLADRPDAIVVEFTVGYGAAETAVPAPIRSWLLLRVSTLNEHREAFVLGNLAAIPATFVDGLLDDYRIHRYS